MNLLSIFHKLISALQIGADKIAAVVKKLESDAPQIEHFAEVALPIIDRIRAIAPNRTLDELSALGHKFQLHVTPEIAADPLQVETLLQNAAMRELKIIAPGIPNSLLRSALAIAFNAYKARL